MKITFLLFYGAPGGWIVDTVALAVDALPKEASFKCLESEFLGMCYDMHKSSGAGDSKKPVARFRSTQHLVRKLYADRGMQLPVAQKRRLEHQLSPNNVV